MTSVSEISVAPMPPSLESSEVEEAYGLTFSSWKPAEAPRPTRPSPTPLIALALLAGIGAIVLSGIAVVAATRTIEDTPAPASEPVSEPKPAPAAKPAVPRPLPQVERQALALLAKPSTDRVPFRGSAGRLVLVVGSGGRAAILLRGFERAPAEWPYYAWIVGRSGKPVRAARFTGSERAVFLSRPVGRGASVVVAPDRAAALEPESARLVAIRG